MKEYGNVRIMHEYDNTYEYWGFVSHSVGGSGRWSIRSLRCSRWPTWNRKFAMPCEKVYEKRGALMGATMTWGISNVAPTRHITIEITQKPGTQMMFCFWLEKDFVSQGYKRVPGAYCFWYHCVCCLRVSIQFRQAQNAPDANKKQDLAVLLSHCHSSEIPSSKGFHNNDSLHPKKKHREFVLLPRHFSLKPGTSACRPNEVVAGPGSTTGCCHRCW